MTNLRNMLLRALALCVSSVVAASLILVGLPQAQAQTNQGWATSAYQYNDCEFRKGSSLVAPYAAQLCWLNLAGFQNLNSTPQTITRDLGRYTMSFDATLVMGKPNVAGMTWPYITTFGGDGIVGMAWGKAAKSGVAGSFDVFSPYGSTDHLPVVQTFHNDPGNKAYKFRFNNIKVVDKFTGQPVNNYRLVVADAESTMPHTSGELLTVNSSDVNMKAYTRITPPSYDPACMPRPVAGTGADVFGPGIEDWNGYGDQQQKDFKCNEFSGLLTAPYAGTYLVGGDAPKNLEVGMFTLLRQGFAVAIDMALMSGNHTENTTFEQQAIGRATTFDFRMALRNNGTDTPVPWQGQGVRTQAIRTMDTADASGTRARDKQVFSSTASGVDATKALYRYKPVWTCNYNNVAYTISEDSVPSGFTLNNDPAKGLSEVVVANPLSYPIDCAVDWQPRFVPATLTLSKSVDGTSANFAEIRDRAFNINYSCTVPDSYKLAYPDIPATQTVALKAGQNTSVKGLPAGSTCTIKEIFTPEDPAALPGNDLDLTWTGGSVSNDTVSLTLAPNANAVAVNNNYDYRGGSIKLDKTILGEPVSDMGDPRDYNFNLRCEGTPYSQNLTMNVKGAGTDVLHGAINFTNVPVERDCYLTPLSGLSDAEKQLISFDGRTVTQDGVSVTALADGSYKLRLADYPEGGTPTSSLVKIEARYSYLSKDVAVLKQVRGPAAGLVDPKATFVADYRCTSATDPTYAYAGQIYITTNSASPATIPGVRVGASCQVWEEPTAAPANTILDKTTISAADAQDVVTELDNETAKTTPVLTVTNSTDPLQNRVVVTNHYINQLGTVTLTKRVDDGGLTSALPADYTLNFRCGTRSIERADGSIQTVDLTGTVTLAADGTATLVGDADSANDRNGKMGVPYGNECTFSENTPSVTEGVLWNTDAGSKNVTVSASDTPVTITNTFSAAGDGVTVTQSYTGETNLVAPIKYELVCRDSAGTALPTATFTLDTTTGSFTQPAASAPEGSTCTLNETSQETGKRGTIPIERTVTVLGQTFDANALMKDVTFTVGTSTVVPISVNYDYVSRTVSVSKDVRFDPATVDYISAERQQVKKDRFFDVQLVCTLPGSGTSQTLSGKVSETTGAITFDNVNEGAECTVTEGATTTAEGINVTQEVSAGGTVKPVTNTFVVGPTNAVELINTYSRRLATVSLDKVAHVPIDLAKVNNFYTHTFTMVCTDPLANGADLGTFTSTITGPGHTDFTDVPVGADCQITGDKFGQLDLKETAPDGTPLETHLRPSRVEWIVDRNDGTTLVDTDLADGETTSEVFSILDDANGSSTNRIRLDNFYDYVYSPLQFRKEITATKQSMDLLSAANPTYSFQYRCQGVGYSLSGWGDIPTEVKWSDFSNAIDNGDGTMTRFFQSSEVKVPSGAWCSVTELSANPTPPELELTVTPEIDSKRVGAENEPAQSYELVNTYARRQIPVLVSALHGGYLEGISGDYAYNLKCTDAAGTTRDVSFTLSEANTEESIPGDAPLSGKTVMLPVGVDCTLDLSGSAALAARPELEMTAGERTPFAQFGSWVDGVANANNPTETLDLVGADQVTSAMKDYKYTFSIPADAQSMGVAAEVQYLRDTVDMSFTKQVEGISDATFTFRNTCTGESFTLQGGQTQNFTGVAVNSSCAIAELDDAVADLEPTLVLGSTGDRLANAAADNASNEFTFDIMPVAEVTDAGDVSYWSLTGINQYPSMKVEKKIEGAVLSSVTGLANVALLADDATSMHFSYTVTNDGASPLTNVTFAEPGLESYISASCTPPVSLAPGASYTCEFDVPITAGFESTYTYDVQPVTVTAQADGGTLTKTDDYGAIRLAKSVSWLLPDTGRQTLVILLVLGMLSLAYGVYRNRRDAE